MNQGSYTVFTSTSPIGKRFELSEGTLKKTVLGQLYAGNYERKSFNSVDEFIEQLNNVSTSQAISASVPADDSLRGTLTVKGKPREGALARTKENFTFPSTAGVMTLDYDPTSVIFSRDELVNLVRTVGDIPEDVALIWWCSGSSHVFNGDTELQGLKGQRLYLLVENARDIPRAGAVLANRCWLMGYGRIEVSKAGAKLERSIFDSAMFEPARLDFIGGAVCEPPVEQRRGSPINLGGTKLLNSVTAFRDLSNDEEAILISIKKEAKDKAEPECDRRREESMAEKMPALQKQLEDAGMPVADAKDRARRILRSAYEGQSLAGDYRLELEDGQTVTVKEILDNRVKYNRVKTKDPIDPEHRGGEFCGILYLDQATPLLHSFAHGRVTYKLIRQTVAVELKAGDRDVYVGVIAQALLSYDDLYTSGGVLVHIRSEEPDNGSAAKQVEFVPLDTSDIGTLIDARVSLYTKHKDGARKAVNCGPDLVRVVESQFKMNPKFKPKKIIGVTNGAYATPDRQFVLKSGFNPDTGIYNKMLDTVTLPETVSTFDVLLALKTIWAPLSEYMWMNAVSRSGALAALFTAVLRPAMATSPGFFFDAAVQNSGKSKAMDAVCAILHGSRIRRSPFITGTDQNAEYGKHMAALQQEGISYWAIDNVVSKFDSPTLAALILGEGVSIRGLGKNTLISGVSRILICATGNNASLGDDLARRFISCRIDAKTENPGEIPHSFDPQTRALATREEIIRSVLIVLKAFWGAGTEASPDNSDMPCWGALVRDPIKWIADRKLGERAGIGELTDPKLALASYSQAPSDEKIGLQQFLLGCDGMFTHSEMFTASELLRAYNTQPSKSDAQKLAAHALLRDGLDSLTRGMKAFEVADSKDSAKAAAIGKVFTAVVGRVRDGIRLKFVKTDLKGKHWCIENLKTETLKLVASA